MKVRRWLVALVTGLAATWLPDPASCEELPEYRLKAAFLYNFALYTEWPSRVGGALKLCVLGNDLFGKELDGLQDKPVGDRRIIGVERKPVGSTLDDCGIVYVAPSAIGELPSVLVLLRGRPVLTVADSPAAARLGVMLDMVVLQGRVAFEVNLRAARSAELDFSSKLLRLAAEVYR